MPYKTQIHCQMSQYWDRGQIKASEQKNHVTYTDQELEGSEFLDSPGN